MQQMELFVRDDVFPSWFANALGKALSRLSSQLQVLKQDATHIVVPAATNAGAIASIGGLWRWVEASIVVAHPGGSAGVYPVFLTAKANDIVTTPDPYTDDTDYSFAVVVKAPGTTPTIVAGTVDEFLHAADVHWDGAQITRIDQLVPAPAPHAGTHATSGTDPLTPADIGAATAAALSTETTNRTNADTSEASTRSTADTNESTARIAGDAARVLTPAAAGGVTAGMVPVATGGASPGYAWGAPAGVSHSSRSGKFAWAEIGSVVVGSSSLNDVPGAWVTLAASESAALQRVFAKLLAGTATVELHRVTWAGVDSVLATINVTTAAQRPSETGALADSDFLYALVTAASSDAAGLSFMADIERTF